MRLARLWRHAVVAALLSTLAVPVFAESGLENKICDHNKYFTGTAGYPDAKPATGKALVYLLRIRDRWGGLMGLRATGARFWIFADDKLVAIVGNDTYSKVELEPGSYRFWAKIDRGKAPIQVLNMKVEADQTYYMFADASKLAFASYGTRLWIHDKAEFLRLRKNFHCRTTMKPGVIAKRRDEFLQKHYEEAKTVINTYPKDLSSSPPGLKRHDLAIIKKRLPDAKVYNVGYAPKEAIPSPSAGKALLVLLARVPDHYYQPRRGYRRLYLHASAHSFIDNRLVSLTQIGAYSVIEVEPGERLFWTSWYIRGGTRSTLNSIRINFQAGETYYIDQVFNSWHTKYSVPIRVVDKAMGESILGDLLWRSVMNKKSRKLEKKIIRRFYGHAKRIASRYPDQQYAAGGYRD